MTQEDLKHKADEYKLKLDQLTTQRQDIDRQLIILGEQHKQYKEKIEAAFGTSDQNKLQEIAAQYLKDIEQLEKQLEKQL